MMRQPCVLLLWPNNMNPKPWLYNQPGARIFFFVHPDQVVLSSALAAAAKRKAACAAIMNASRGSPASSIASSDASKRLHSQRTPSTCTPGTPSTKTPDQKIMRINQVSTPKKLFDASQLAGMQQFKFDS